MLDYVVITRISQLVTLQNEACNAQITPVDYLQV